MVLRVIGDAHVVPERARAPGLFFHAREDFTERGLARAVHADDGNAVALADLKVQRLQNIAHAIVALCELFETDNSLPALRRLGEFESDLVVLVFQFDALHLVELFHAALHHGGFVGRGTEAVDEALCLRNLALLVGGGTLELLAARSAFAHEERVVAVVKIHPALLKGEGAVGQIVEQPAVVADENDGARISVEIFLKPDHGFDVEMVGRFIQQQHAWLREQEFRQGNAHLPAAAEFVGETVEIRARKPKPREHALDARLHFCQVVMFQPDLQIAISLQRVGILRRVMMVHTQRLIRLIELALQFQRVFKCRLCLRHQGAAFDLHAFLRKIADLHGLGLDDAPLVLMLDARDDFHQRAFAGAVRSGQRDAFTGANREI